MPSRQNCSSSAHRPRRTGRSGTRPRGGWRAAGVAASPIPGTAMPKEAGPASRMPARRVASISPDSCAVVRPAVTTASDLTPRIPHSRATSPTRAAGTVTTARSGASGSAATDGTHGMPSMSPPPGLTAYNRAGESCVADVQQDRPADRTGTAARAGHRNRPGIQQRLQAGHIRVPVPPGHRIQIGAGLTQGRNSRHRDGQLDHAIIPPAPQREPRVGQHMQDGVVVRQHLGGEGRHAAGTGQRHQVLQQQRGDTAAVHAVGDRKRDLRSRPIAGELVTGHPHQLVAQQADQRHHARPAFQAHPPGLPLGRYPARAEKPEIQALRRHRLVQPLDSLVIPGPGRPDGQRGAVDQQRIRPAGPAVLRAPGQQSPPALTADPVTNPSSRIRDPGARPAAGSAVGRGWGPDAQRNG